MANFCASFDGSRLGNLVREAMTAGQNDSKILRMLGLEEGDEEARLVKAEAQAARPWTVEERNTQAARAMATRSAVEAAERAKHISGAGAVATVRRATWPSSTTSLCVNPHHTIARAFREHSHRCGDAVSGSERPNIEHGERPYMLSELQSCFQHEVSWSRSSPLDVFTRRSDTCSGGSRPVGSNDLAAEVCHSDPARALVLHLLQTALGRSGTAGGSGAVDVGGGDDQQSFSTTPLRQKHERRPSHCTPHRSPSASGSL